METGTRMNKIFLSGLCNNASHAFAAASLLNTCQDTFQQTPGTHELSSEAAPSRTEVFFVEYSKFSALIEKMMI